MEAFGYLSILTSIVLGLGITRILTGCGRLLQARHCARTYRVHLVWALNLFLYLVLDWWILFRWRTQPEWNFFLFLFVLLTPTICFIMSVLLFPEPMEDGIDLKQHYYSNHRSFFILAALLAPVDALDTLLKGWHHFLAQGVVYPFVLLVVLFLSLTAAVTKNDKYHSFFVVFFLIFITAFISINLRVLG